MKKVLSIILCLVVVMSIIMVLPSNALAKETVIISTGVESDFGQPGSSRNNAGNCVTYTQLRFQEVYGFALHGTGGDNARGYYTNAASFGDTVSSTPRAGALAVWDYDTGGYGSHVAFVEKVVGSTVYVTEGGWSDTGYHEDSLSLSNMSRSWTGHYQSFLGFVYVKGAIPDNSDPVISNARAANISANSFDIKCDLSDDVGVTRVWLNVYGPGGQNGYEVSASNGSFSHTIYTSNYGGSGLYTVHIYAFDAAGHQASSAVNNINAINDTSAPVISNPRAENVNGSSFDIKCELSDNVGVTRVYVIVYSPDGTQNTGYDVPASIGSFSHTIRTAQYGGAGVYKVHLYAFDSAGNQSPCAINDIQAVNDTTTPVISNPRAENVSSSSFDIKCELSDNVGVTRVYVIVYSPDGTQNTGYDVSASNGSFSHTIMTAQYGGAGIYRVHLYAFDSEGNQAPCAINDIQAYDVAATSVRNNHRYELINIKTTWKQAKRACELKGGHLAVINSAEENSFLRDMTSKISTRYWDSFCIGGSDEVSEDNWYWINGDEFTYTNWENGEPLNVGGAENYITFLCQSGTWNSVADGNGDIVGFICEYDSIPLLGDVDGDEEVGVRDATYIQRYDAGFNIPISEDTLLSYGDVNGDEEVSILDATYIQRYDAGFNTPYPIGETIA